MMSKNISVDKDSYPGVKRLTIITFVGAVLIILSIIATLEVSHRHISTFITVQQKYIIAIETAFLLIFVTEMLVRIMTLLSPSQEILEHGARLRLTFRIVGYLIAFVSVAAILASNSALGISVGAIGGAIVAFSAQNYITNVFATVVLFNTRMVHVGEEITIGETKGIVSDIDLTHTMLSVDDDVVFVPNSLPVSSIVRRRKRNANKDADVRQW
jgi:small-conductance mechanosensitive channel